MSFKRHHIRQWSQSARTKAGEKVQTFVWSCSTCKVRNETTSKAKRTREVTEHEKEPIQ